MATLACVLALRPLDRAAGISRGSGQYAGPPTTEPVADSIRWPAAPVIAPADWLPLRARAGGPPGSGADETRAPARYRLAGTLLLRTDDGTVRYGRAIIDDTEEKRQLVLAEQETSGDLRVLRIDWNRATVEIAGQVYTLSMRFAGNVAPPSEPGGVIAAAASAAPLEVSRFGRKVQPDRWLIEREAVLEYYRELRDDPVRVARLYESFRPVREGPDGHITGYELNILGEEEFLRAVGLQQGDVVRAVNSMPMTSQSRAEFFIAEFLKENLNAIVLDIERNRQPQKLVYLIR